MMENDWSRNYINAQTARITRMFRWAAAEEMLPASVHDQLATGERDGLAVQRRIEVNHVTVDCIREGVAQ